MRARRAFNRILPLWTALFMLPSGALHAQEDARAIDRWLVSHVIPIRGEANPLEIDGRQLFPDRDRSIGPGYWTLLREDGQASFDLADVGERPSRATTTLAHAYIRSPSDVTADLAVESHGCAGTAAWLNGQRLADVSRDLPIRLAAGWNGLLISLSGEECELGVTLGAPDAPLRDDEEPVRLDELRIQASRPPGARPNRPDGAIVLGAPMPVALEWMAEEEHLVARVAYTATAWGGVAGLGPLARGDAEIPEGPPTVDLTGEWTVTFYTPTGIQTAHATLEMAQDGTLTGRLVGERIDGDIRDGWVSGDEFGWRMRFGGRGRDLELGIRGVLTDDVMTGALDYGGFRDFEARFEGERAAAEGDDAEGEREAEGEEEAGAEEEAGPGGAADPASAADPGELEDDAGARDPGTGLPPIPAPGDRAPSEGEDALAAPPDPDGLRARIVRQLLPPPERPPRPAPDAALLEADIGGEDLELSFEALVPLVPQTAEARAPFNRVRAAALDDDGFEARVTWLDDDYDFVGRVPAAALLQALHEPIALSGWGLSGADGFAGTFRIPRTLDGFTLHVGPGTWMVDGAPLGDAAICAPCSSGDRYDLSVTDTGAPTVRIADPGYPAAGADGVDAETWLDALEGDNRRYRELGRASS